MFENITWPMACVFNVKTKDEGSKCGGTAEVSHGRFVEAVEMELDDSCFIASTEAKRFVEWRKSVDTS